MSDAAATAERREEILGELAEWMHAGAREAQRRLLEAETTDDFVKLTGSLAKLARGVRQSILIHRKLEAERLAAAHRADAEAARAEAGSEMVPRHMKRVRIRTAITRHVWNELEDEDAELFRDDLTARLDELEGCDDFLDTPIDDLIERLCRDLGFDPPDPPASPRPAGLGGRGRPCGPSRSRRARASAATTAPPSTRPTRPENRSIRPRDSGQRRIRPRTTRTTRTTPQGHEEGPPRTWRSAAAGAGLFAHLSVFSVV